MALAFNGLDQVGGARVPHHTGSASLVQPQEDLAASNPLHPTLFAVTRPCSARLKMPHNLGVPAVTFSRSLCFDPCTLLISTARLFPLYSVIARLNVGGQSSIFRVEVNFWSQSRGQGF